MASKFIFLVLFCICAFNTLWAEDLESLELPPSYEKDMYMPSHGVYTPSSRAGYLATGTTLILGGTILGAGVLYLMPESVTNWNKDDIVNLGANWRRKTARGPVVDGDDWFLNWITHPYWGAVYYMQPRSAGYSWAESALFSALASALFWEYGIEAFAETPSWQDLVITPAIGSILGEVFYRVSYSIHQKGDTLYGSRFLGKTALLLMDPVGFALRDVGIAGLVGIKDVSMSSYVVPVSGRSGNGVQFVLSMRF